MRRFDALLLPQPHHHLNSCRIKISGHQGSIRATPITPSAGRNPNQHPSLPQQRLHFLEGANVVAHLLRPGGRVIHYVLLGVDAQQVAPHAERLAKFVAHYSITGDVGHLFAQPGVRVLCQQRNEGSVALRLVVGEKDDVLALIEVSLDLGPPLGIHEYGAVEVDHATDILLSHFVIVGGTADSGVVRRELVRDNQLLRIRLAHQSEYAVGDGLRLAAVACRFFQLLRVHIHQIHKDALDVRW
mmetsp:Transcript_19078/g.33985  ORF Transcript_19078/g.33985 Transcript_19078/m.33985 type:complete len:243 (-) Transcript_19078:392-1120(-)